MRTHPKPREPYGRLTPKQAAFCAEYLRDMNATGAAKRAGYSPRSADRIAVQLLSKDHVRARVEQLQAARNERVKIDADWVLKRLVAELEANVQDLYDDTGMLKRPHDWPEVWQKGLVTSIRTTELYNQDGSGKPKAIGQMKDITLADRVKRIELLGKHVSIAAFREKVQVAVENPLQQLYDQIKGNVIRPASERMIEHHANEPRQQRNDEEARDEPAPASEENKASR